MDIKGSWVAIPTPFNDDNSINYTVFEEIIDFHVAHKTDGLLVLGSAGEASMLTVREKQEVIEFTTDYARNESPLLVGTTGPDTSTTIKMTEFARECNADGALMVLPPYIKPPQRDILEFYQQVAGAVDIPIAVYNNPSRVGVNINADTLVKISRIPGVVAIKEAVGDVSQLIKVRKEMTDSVDVLTCDSPAYSIILPNLAIGGEGVTNITGNLAPEEFAELSREWKDFSDVVRSRKLVEKYFQLMQLCYSVTNPVVIKAGLNLLGFSVGSPRKPLKELDEEKLQNLKQTMEDLGLIEKYGRKK